MPRACGRPSREPAPCSSCWPANSTSLAKTRKLCWTQPRTPGSSGSFSFPRRSAPPGRRHSHTPASANSRRQCAHPAWPSPSCVPSGFASNAFAWADPVRTKRTVFAPFGDVALPVIDPADIAAVAAAVLREDGHADRVYELTGPERISPRQQTAAISEALGEEVTFVDLSREEAQSAMAQFMPPDVVTGTLDVLGTPLPAEQEISPDIQTILNRPATPFRDWATHNLPAFQ